MQYSLAKNKGAGVGLNIKMIENSMDSQDRLIELDTGFLPFAILHEISIGNLGMSIIE